MSVAGANTQPKKHARVPSSELLVHALAPCPKGRRRTNEVQCFRDAKTIDVAFGVTTPNHPVSGLTTMPEHHVREEKQFHDRAHQSARRTVELRTWA